MGLGVPLPHLYACIILGAIRFLFPLCAGSSAAPTCKPTCHAPPIQCFQIMGPTQWGTWISRIREEYQVGLKRLSYFGG